MAWVLALALFQDPSPESLVERLRSEDLTTREEGLRALRAMGPAARPALESAVRDADPAVVAAARQLLGRIGLMERLSPRLRRARPDVEDRLNGGNDHAWTSELLAAAGHADLEPEDLEELAERALRGAGDRDERGRVIELIGRGGSRAAVRLLLPYLGPDVDPEERKLAARQLRDTEATEALPRLLQMARDADPALRVQAIDALTTWNETHAFRTPATAAVIHRLTSDSDEKVRQAAEDGSFGPTGCSELYSSLLRSRDSAVVQRALARVRQWNARHFAPDVLPLLSSDQPAIVELAVDFADACRVRRAVPGLLQAARTAPESVAVRALAAVASLGDAASVRDVAAFLRDERAPVRAAAAWTFGTLGAEESVPELLRVLRDDPSPATRAAAGGALALLRHAPALKWIEPLCGDASAEVRAEALLAYTWLADRANGVRKSIALLRDPDATVRDAALECLAELRGREAIPEIVKLLANAESAEMSWQALRALEARETVADLLPLLKGPQFEETRYFFVEQRVKDAACGFVELLKSGDLEIVCDSLEALVTIGAREAVPHIMPLLQHADDEVRESAVDALAALGPEVAREELEARIGDPSGDVRAAIARALAAAGDRRSVPLLVSRVGDADPDVARAAAEALRELDEDAGLEVALKVLRGATQERVSALTALAVWGRRESAAAVRAVLRDPEPRVRAAAVTALARIEGPAALDALRAAMRDEEPAVRRDALDAVDALRLAAAAPDVAALLDDRYFSVRSRARYVAGAIGAREAVPRLVAMLEAEVRIVERLFLAEALAELGAPEGARELLRLVREDREYWPTRAMDALARFGVRDAIPDLLNVARSSHAWHVDSAVRALGALKAAEAIPVLVDLIVLDRNWPAAEALAEVPGGAEAAAKLLDHPIAAVRAMGLSVVGRARVMERADVVVRGLTDGSPAIREQAVEAARRMKLASAAPALLRMLREDPVLRMPCAVALTEIGATEAAEGIAALLQSPEERTRAGAAAALAQLGARKLVPALEACLSKEWCRASMLEEASALCRLGSRAGAARILAEAETDSGVRVSLVASALASERWEALGRARPGAYKGSLRGAMELVARSAGLALDLPRETPGVRYWLDMEVNVEPDEDGASLVERLTCREDLEFAPDGGRLRVMRRREALAFWKARLKE